MANLKKIAKLKLLFFLITICTTLIMLSCGKEEPCETRKTAAETDFEYVDKDSTSSFKNKHVVTLTLKKDITEYTSGQCQGGVFGTVDLKIENITNKVILVKIFNNQENYNKQINYLTLTIQPLKVSEWREVGGYFGDVSVPIEFIAAFIRLEYN